MEVDVAVLGGGPVGTRPRFARPSSARSVACIEKEPELGGTCLRVGCIPTKAWVQTAQFLHQANDVFGKLGVSVEQPRLDFARRERVEGRRRQADDRRRRLPLQGERRGMGEGHRHLHRREHDLGRGRRGRHASSSAIVATGSFPMRPPIPGLESDLCVDSTGLLAQTEVPRRLVDPRRRHHRLRVRLDLQPLRLRGDDRRDARHADPAGGRGRGQGAREGSSASAGSRCSSASSARRSSSAATG